MFKKTACQTGATKTSKSDQYSNEFLKRIEHQRLDSECLQLLDLRPYVSDSCKLFSYRGKSLWLNSEARQLFQKGLDNNSGVFTVGTYESILNHFFKDQDKLQTVTDKDDLGVADSGANQNLSLLSTSDLLKKDQTDHDLAIDLSYYERRVYDRIKTSLLVGLSWKGKIYTAETRDISQTGLQLRLRTPIQLSVDDIVRIDLTPLVVRDLKNPFVDYRVVRTRRLLNAMLIGLQCVEKEAKDGLSAITDFVAGGSHSILSEQTDPEDALLTAKALLAERFYMRSTSILPFFIFKNQEDQPPLRIIFNNSVNKRYLDVFEKADKSYDFSSLVTPKRIKLLTRLALRDSKANTLIAVYKTDQTSAPKVVADLECKNYKHWKRLLLRYGKKSSFRVFKVVARMARRPVEMRVEDALDPLSSNYDDFLNKLLKEAQHLTIVGALIDVTEQIRSSCINADGFNKNTLEQPVICHTTEEPCTPPKLIPIHYIQENRSEQRYLGRMEVEIVIAGLYYRGVTHDVSAHGLSVELSDPYVAFIHHREAILSFPKLEAYASGRLRNMQTFRNIPAEIVGKSTDGEQVLRLKICDVSKGRQFSSAFLNLLSKRDSDLCRDCSHTLRAATSRLYSSIFIESASTLPIFIYHNDSKDWAFRIGLTNSPAPLIDYFEVTDGFFDFSALTNQSRLQQLMREVSDYGSSELILYLKKKRCQNAPKYEIRSLADLEITDVNTRNKFIREAIGTQFRCLKIQANLPMIPPKAEIDQAVDRLVQLSHAKSERLKSEFGHLIAIGDVIDVTGLVLENITES